MISHFPSTQATITGGTRITSDYIHLGSDLLPEYQHAYNHRTLGYARGLQRLEPDFRLRHYHTENLFMSWTRGYNTQLQIKVGWKRWRT